jgi:hypothetical protein
MSEIGTTTSSVNLRAGPGTSNAITETLKPGTELTILGRQGEWLSVRVGPTGREGFVHDDFVRLPSQKIISGFLRSVPELQAAPLAPARPKQPPAGSGAAAKTAARIWNQYGGLLTTLSARLGFEPEVGVAVMAVESGGIAFKDGRMVIRFENHVFFKHWGVDNKAKFDRHFRFNPSEKWKGHEFRASTAAAFKPFHGTGQANEWTVFEFAQALDRKDARFSISMGLPQVMGFNFTSVGYGSVDEMFDAFNHPRDGERAQVLGMFDFIKGPRTTSEMVEALGRRDWVAFATRYNGRGQAEKYGKLLSDAHKAAKSLV